MNKIVNNAKDRRREGIESNDLASILTFSKDENGKEIFSEKEVKCQLFTFAFGGHETSASTLIWALYFLGEYPEWADTINKEFEQHGCVIDSKTLQNIPKTTSFIKETLRLCHTLDLYIPRKTKADIELPNGRILPKNFTFTIDLANMNTAKDVWGSDSFEFNPNRFFKEDKGRHSYQYLPFGGGKRNCIGQNFAMQEMKIFLLRIASQIKIENDVKQRSIHSRQPPNQWTGMTWKIKEGSLYQRFTPKL